MNIHTRYFDNLNQFKEFMNQLAQEEESILQPEEQEPTDKELEELEAQEDGQE